MSIVDQSTIDSGMAGSTCTPAYLCSTYFPSITTGKDYVDVVFRRALDIAKNAGTTSPVSLMQALAGVACKLDAQDTQQWQLFKDSYLEVIKFMQSLEFPGVTVFFLNTKVSMYAPQTKSERAEAANLQDEALVGVFLRGVLSTEKELVQNATAIVNSYNARKPDAPIHLYNCSSELDFKTHDDIIGPNGCTIINLPVTF